MAEYTYSINTAPTFCQETQPLFYISAPGNRNLYIRTFYSGACIAGAVPEPFQKIEAYQVTSPQSSGFCVNLCDPHLIPELVPSQIHVFMSVRKEMLSKEH